MTRNDALSVYADRMRRLVEQDLEIAADLRDLAKEMREAGLQASVLKAWIKAQIKADDGDTGALERLKERTQHAAFYADALGIPIEGFGERNRLVVNELPVDREARAKRRMSESMDDNKAMSAELMAAGLISAEAHAETVRISDGVARKLGDGVIDPETGEIIESQAPTDGEGGNPASLQEDSVEHPAVSDPSKPTLAAAGEGAGSADSPVPSDFDPVADLPAFLRRQAT